MNIFKFRKPESDYTSVSLNRMSWNRLKSNKLGMAALCYILIISIIAVLGYLITPDSTPYANRQCLEIAMKKPGYQVTMVQIPFNPPVEKVNWFQKMLFGQPAVTQDIPIEFYHQKTNCPHTDKRFLLGTDRYGRDILSQLIIGTRVSLSVGLISVFIALIIGILIGAIAGYYRGWIDDFLMWFINVIWSIPTVLLVIAISFALGKGFWQIFIAIGLTMWVDVARVVRGQFIGLREKEFVEAGKALGFNDYRIMVKHILPNTIGTLMVITASNFSSAILIEAGLSFLGLGVQAPMPSWGMMIKENYACIVLYQAYLALVPGIAIMLLVLAFMIVGSSLRNAFDVRQLTH